MKTQKTFRLATIILAGFVIALLYSCSDDDNDPTYGDGITDIDGNEYVTVIIGDQEWMAENLKTTKYCNSISIPETDTWQHQVNSGPGYSYPERDPNNNSLYGKLYNWYAANNINNICP